jgi:hypothetical protein
VCVTVASSFHCLLYTGNELDSTFTPMIVAQQLLRAGAAHKPTYYDLGGGTSVQVKALDGGDDDSDNRRGNDADFD